MFRRGFRGSRRRSGAPRPFVQTFKKVLNYADASFAGASSETTFIAKGVDSIALGQTSAGDVDVPTGSKIKYFEIQFACNNSTGPNYVNCSIQYVLSTQLVVLPDVVGGDPQRNQVFHQDMFSVGANQNSTHKFKFKIPPKYQRLREGMIWVMVWGHTATINRKIQIIYKVER